MGVIKVYTNTGVDEAAVYLAHLVVLTTSLLMVLLPHSQQLTLYDWKYIAISETLVVSFVTGWQVLVKQEEFDKKRRESIIITTLTLAILFCIGTGKFSQLGVAIFLIFFVTRWVRLVK